MLELIVCIVLTGAFWTYGKEMRTGKWFSIAVLWSCFVFFWSIGWHLIGPLISAVVAGLVLVVYGHMKDEVRAQRIKDARESDDARRCPRARSHRSRRRRARAASTRWLETARGCSRPAATARRAAPFAPTD